MAPNPLEVLGELGRGTRANLEGVPWTFEASAWRNLIEGNWEGAVDSARLWHVDEPFSSRPAEFGSWVAPVTQGDFKAGEGFARAGLLTNPGDFLLLNNLAVSLAEQDRVSEALEVFQMIPVSAADSRSPATYLATRGLIAYRAGDPETGRLKYKAAVEAAKKKKVAQEVVWALFYYAQEEFRFDPTAAAEILREGKEKLARLPAGQRRVGQRILDRALGCQPNLGI